jgi:protein involved in polysaccharide export with SLBB domain
MNSNTRQTKSGSFDIEGYLSVRRATTGIVFVQFCLAACCLLLGTDCLFGAEPKFADFPGMFHPATNNLKASVAAGGQTNADGSISQGATNSSGTGVAKSMAALDDKYRLAIGDRLSYRIVEDEEDPKPLSVTDSGDLEFPYIGRFPAVGKTCKDLARELKAELEKEYYYQATVIIAVDFMTRSRGKVYLVGPVRSPGPQDVPSDEALTLSKAILRAGGFSDYADRKNVKVTRKSTIAGAEDETFTVNVEEILEKSRTDSDLPLQAGDLIYIPERLIRF